MNPIEQKTARAATAPTIQPDPALTRRQLIKGAAAFAVGAPYILRTSGALAQGAAAPSNRINIGCIGIGGMGGGHLGGLLGRREVQVVAVCDVDANRRKAARERSEKAYADAMKSGSFKGVTEYPDFRELLARPDIDAVMIATPDHWHVLTAAHAIRSGKDVYVEKPLTLTIAEGRFLSDETQRYGRVLQVGSQQRSSERFRRACEIARNGRIGEIKTVRVGLPTGRATTPKAPQPVPPELDYEMWLGPAPYEPYFPERVHYNFRWFLDYSGGQTTNFGAHDLDITQWGLGMDDSGPVEVEGKAEFAVDGPYNTPVKTTFQAKYANGVEVFVTTGGSGVRFEGTEGWVYVNRGTLQASKPSLLTTPTGPNEIRLYESRDHWGNFLDCVRTRQQPICTAEIGHRTATFCHLANIAMLLERKVRWNPATEQVVGDDEAARMTSRAKRAPWTL